MTENNSAIRQAVHSAAELARKSSRILTQTTRAHKDQALYAIAAELESQTEYILDANHKDVTQAKENNMSEGLIDRLYLDRSRIFGIAEAVREIAALPDPIGEVVRGAVMPNGLRVTQRRVPLGVVGMIYEARPNVTVDAAALTLKSGNAVLLRGGSAASHSNLALTSVVQQALEASGLPRGLVQSLDEWGREGAQALMHARGLVDVLIPRGGAGLIAATAQEATVPVIETGVGNCHLYVDATADLKAAEEILLNAKTQRVGVCNAAETLLVHASVAAEFLPRALSRLVESGVTLHIDDVTREIVESQVALPPENLQEATETDWSCEYLSLDMAVKVVPDIDAALKHIITYSTGHTEAICTRDTTAVHRFTTELDSAAIAVNASTRFTDGGQLGLGAEIGISTQKLHARGPLGLSELTTTTWIIEGDGHIRA